MPNTIDSSVGRIATLPVLQSDSPAPPASPAQTSNKVNTEPSLRLTEPTIVISAEAMARLNAFQSPLVPVTSTQPLTRAALGLSNEPQGVDLSRHQPTMSLSSPHWNDLSGLLARPGLSAEDSKRLSGALNQAAAIDQQVSSDPAVDLAVRKMKLDYIRDNLVPEAFRAQADAAISSYVSHQVADLDQMTSLLTQRSVEIARSTGHSAQAQSIEQEMAALGQGTASRQQYMNRMLGVTQNRKYGSPAQADSASAQVIGGIRSMMLEAVGRWPREQERGRAQVDNQVGSIQNNWSNFIASVR